MGKRLRGEKARRGKDLAAASAYVCLAAASQAARLDLISASLKGQRGVKVWWSKAFTQCLREGCWAGRVGAIIRCTNRAAPGFFAVRTVRSDKKTSLNLT